MTTDRLELTVHPERLVVARDPVDATPPDAPVSAVLRRGDETTWVGPEDRAPACARLEPGWRAIEVSVPEGAGLDFGLVGVLASIAGPLAAAGVPIFVLSTFDTDLVLVKEARLGEAIDALRRAGHRVTSR